MTCSECGARTGLTLSARGEDTTITCPAGHTTRDWRLTPMAVRDVAAAAAEAGVDEVPANAEVWVKVRTETDILPVRGHRLTVDSFLEFLIAEVPVAGVTA